MRLKMKKSLNNQKGVSLTSLAVAIIVILILTSVTLYNATGNIKISKLKGMQTDIENLTDRVSSYYAQYGKLPVNTNIEYTNINNIRNAGVISSATDTGKFYAIDLAAMENITLNYGQDYEKIKNGEASTQEQVNQLLNLYIINETSHNIFYVEGIKVDNDVFYTNYTAEDVDKAIVNLRYYDNVEIPDGFYYVGGTKDTGLVISDVQGDDLENSKRGNQFVWIPVEKESDYIRNTTYNDKNISANAKAEIGYLPDGIADIEDSSGRNEEAEKQAVISAHGFFVSRFEAGNENGKLVSKKGTAVWNNISQADSKTKAKSFINNNSVKSALCSGVQWDKVMQFANTSEFNVTQSLQERHTRSLTTTGTNLLDISKNIYDLEGNLLERVAEIKDDSCVVRGGYYNDNNSASTRQTTTSSADSNIGFRFVLYVIPRDNWSSAYDKTTTYKDRNEDVATIPKGFKVSRKVNENTIETGLVVQAPDGSEFVWIPVPNAIYNSSKGVPGKNNYTPMAELQSGSKENYQAMFYTFNGSTPIYQSEWKQGTTKSREPSLATGSEEDTKAVLENIRGNSSDADFKNYNTILGYNSAKEFGASMQKEYDMMVKSVEKYGGFYVGRYEVGIEGTNTVSKNAKNNSNVETFKNAPYTWYNLYKICRDYSNSGTVKSSLIWGSQYDAMLNWMAKQNVQISSPNENKHNNTEITGNSNTDILNNIYDLYGCYHEWTMEAEETGLRIIHGAGYYSSSNGLDYRYHPAVGNTNGLNGGRLTLYIN